MDTKRRRKHKIIKLHCRNCNNEFIKSKLHQLHCSRSCAIHYKKVRYAIKHKLAYDKYGIGKPVYKITCKHCGSTKAVYEKSQEFCSTVCERESSMSIFVKMFQLKGKGW